MFLLSRCRRSLAVAAIVGVLVSLSTGINRAQARTVPMCFPVIDEPVSYHGTFGDARGGGRSHEGEDIMGQKMFRIVAPVDGVVLNGTDGIRWSGDGFSDHSLRMRGDDGYYYAFLHMNDDTPGTDDGNAGYDQVFGPGIASGARVRAGQLLGYMGDSGNAEGTSPHLHFEMREPDPNNPTGVWSSTAFDPYDSLQAALRCGGNSFEEVLAGDFDGDRIGDLFGYASGPAADRVYHGTAERTLEVNVTHNVNGTYAPLTGDFDGDGRSDVLWYGPGSPQESIWFGTSTPGEFETSPSPPVHGTYTPLLGDFDGDGYGDITWYAPGTAPDYVWYGTGTRGQFVSRQGTANGHYRPIAGDFDGDAFDDIFWYAPGTAPDYVWYGTGTRGGFVSRQLTVNGTYEPFTGNFDGDGFDDVYWYAPGTAADYLWYGSASRDRYTSVNRNVSGSYRPVSTDLDGDGFDDIFWWAPDDSITPTWYSTRTRGQFVFTRLAL